MEGEGWTGTGQELNSMFKQENFTEMRDIYSSISWIVPLKRRNRPDCSVEQRPFCRLLCIHWAGANPGMFRDWADDFTLYGIDVYGAVLRSREREK